MPRKNHFETLAVAFSCFSLFTGLRVIDSGRMLCNQLHKLPPDATTPRRFKFSIPVTKNDIAGDGPIEGRTFVLPCSCMRNSTKLQAKTFSKALRVDLFCRCPLPCCFQVKIFLNYFPVLSFSNFYFVFCRFWLIICIAFRILLGDFTTSSRRGMH